MTNERLRAALVAHYVTAIECDHEAKTDTIRCVCSVWTGTPQPSVGRAVEQWADHVLAVLDVERAAIVGAARDVRVTHRSDNRYWLPECVTCRAQWPCEAEMLAELVLTRYGHPASPSPDTQKES